MHRRITLLGGLMLTLSATGAAGDGPAANPPAEVVPSTDTRLSQLVETIVREAIPRRFEDRKHWGQREQVVSGLDIETKGIGLRISKRERGVRHGLWRRYLVTLVDPQETLRLRIENLRSPAAGQFRWDLFVRLRANVDVRFEHWNLGVKLLNTHADADTTLEMHADCSLTFRLENTDAGQGPVVVLEPTVHTVGLRLPDLDVNRFSGLRGSVAEEIGNGLEDVFEKLLQSQEKSIRKQAQRAIDKHAADLRIPLGDVLSSPLSTLMIGI